MSNLVIAIVFSVLTGSNASERLCPAPQMGAKGAEGLGSISTLNKSGLPHIFNAVPVNPKFSLPKTLQPILKAYKTQKATTVRTLGSKALKSTQIKDADVRAVIRYLMVTGGKLSTEAKTHHWKELSSHPCFYSEAVWALATAAQARNRSKSAVTWFQKVPRWDRRWREAQLRIAEQLAKQGRAKDALNQLKQVDPQSYKKPIRRQFWWLVETLASRTRNKQMQRYALQTLWTLGTKQQSKISRKLRRLKAPITWGDHVEQQLSKLTTSMRSVRKILKRSKRLARRIPGMLQYIRGVAISKLFQHRKKSIVFLKRATWHLKRRKDRARAHYQLGHILGRLGREKEGLGHLLKVVTLVPGSTLHEKTLWRLYRMYQYLDRYPDATRVLVELGKAFPWSKYGARALWARAWMAYRSDKLKLAHTLMTEVAERYGHQYSGGRQPRISQAMYWIARIEDKMGRKARAKQLWAEIIRAWPMGHYAHLSRKQLTLPFPALVDGKIPRHQPDKLLGELEVSQHPALLHSIMLTRLGLHSRAESVLNHQLNGHLPAGGGDLLVALAANNNNHQRVRYLVRYRMSHIAAPDKRSIGTWRHYLEAPFSKAFKAASKASGTPQSLLYSIGFHESRFNPKAHSVANAIGILQVVPSVEQTVARALGKSPKGRRELRKAEYNVRVAAFFLSGLLHSVSNNTLVLVAAYASGSNVLARWLKRNTTRQIDEFVESMPYASVRSYAKGVGVFSAAFARIYPEWREANASITGYNSPVPNKLSAFVISKPKNLELKKDGLDKPKKGMNAEPQSNQAPNPIEKESSDTIDKNSQKATMPETTSDEATEALKSDKDTPVEPKVNP